jgi:hypothetical protein
VWALVKGNVGRQYSNQTTLDMVYGRLMHEFNVLEDKGHHFINAMIEKCASLAWKFYGEIEKEDEIDNDATDDRNNQSDDSQDGPPDPPATASMIQGSKGVIAVAKRGVLDPLPWCNGPGMTTEPTKMRLPGIKISSFWCFITS